MRSLRTLSIGRLAALSGVNLETIRYYERIGLMPRPARTQGGHRAYEAAHVARLSFIRRARDLGFGLDEIHTLLDLAEPSRRPCEEVRAIAEVRLEAVRRRLADLQRLEALLARTIARCAKTGPAPSCPVLEMLEAPR